MFQRVPRHAFLLCLFIALTGCETLPLPGFDGGMLNPDIRHLRGGVVMNGIKCAMTEFMRERDLRLISDRWHRAKNRYDGDEGRRRFLPYTARNIQNSTAP